MKLKKVVINGKTYYEEVEEEEAIEPEVIDPKPKTEQEKTYKGNDKIDDFVKSINKDKIKSDWNEFTYKVKNIGKNICDGVSKATKNMFQETKQGEDTTNRLLKILPYMSEKDIHEVAKKILANDKDFKDVDYAAIMPFMKEDDCNAIFMKVLKENGPINMKMVHFVSKDTLSHLVDAYIDGKYSDLDVDGLYPFLDKEDVKKLFYFELKKNNNQEKI